MAWIQYGALALLALGLPGSAYAQRRPPVPPAGTVPVGEWQLPGRDYGLTRFSPLGQISATNVANLKPVWSFSTGSLRGHEGSPLVVGSTMYVHTPFPNAVFALDLARAGAPMLWKYEAPQLPRAPAPLTGCCDVGSRGLAYHPSGKLFVPILSGDLVFCSGQVALDPDEMQTLLVFTATPGTKSAERLRLLAVVGSTAVTTR